jgi:hypothetical protein
MTDMVSMLSILLTIQGLEDPSPMSSTGVASRQDRQLLYFRQVSSQRATSAGLKMTPQL